MNRIGTSSLKITDPYVKYSSLLATGECFPDPGQHRLARHLQKIYLRLQDYTPPSEYQTRLRQITKAIDVAKENESEQFAVKSHPIRRNPLFAHFFRQTEDSQDSLALTRVLTSHQAALQVNSPKGLFLSGEVGTGKSMLLDLLADGLPTARKRRWHFNTFMLYTFSSLEQFRKAHPEVKRGEGEYSLLWMAKEMIEKSPILFLDEFQFPDRAASKILSNLFIAFFQLGGVLVASSNRMPDELEKATGVQYAPPPPGGLIRHLFGLGGGRKPAGELFGGTSDFAAFLEVLNARCDFWHMEGVNDWRRRDAQDQASIHTIQSSETGLGDDETNLNIGDEVPSLATDAAPESPVTTPMKYVLSVDQQEKWDELVLQTMHNPLASSLSWTPATLVVYGRAIAVPKQHGGISSWDFGELVHSLGPADYITLASNYHTFIIDKVPVLTLSLKNEARRFITLLDALYEARCKVLIRAEAGPDELFFPEQKRRKLKPGQAPSKSTGAGTGKHTDSDDATYSETISEVFQDSVSPFRPNISTYTDSPNSDYIPDVDSDFGIEKKVDFANTSAFTGEDERFAYKRAASRLWELCSSQWHARTGDGWWQPLPIEARHWEGSVVSKPLNMRPGNAVPGDVAYGPSIDLDEPAGLARLRLDEFAEMDRKRSE